MYKPRKTTELGNEIYQDSSRKQPSRQSRIARRTDLPSERKISTDRRTVAGSSRGNNFVTPVKTPAKGGFAAPNSEIKRPTLDKKWAFEESVRITEYLREIQADVGKDFYSRQDGIRSMSTKDFVAILNFFLASLGNRLEIKSAKDYVEETIKSMEKLKYPFNLTKSSLKTPTAPHSITNIVQLLSWLKNLHKHQIDKGWENDFQVFREETFPNIECQINIQAVATESFKIWNSNQGEEEDQFDDIEEKAINKIIREKTGIHNISEVIKRTENTWKKCEQLQNDIDSIKIPEELEQKLAHLMNDFKNYQSEINILEMNRKNQENEITQIQDEMNLLQNHGKDLQENLEKLKNAISGQKASVQERDAQINKVLFLEGKVIAVKNSIKEIVKTISNDAAAETSLLRKIPILIGKLKDFLSQIRNHIPSNPNIFDNIDLEDNTNFPTLLESVKKVEIILKDAEKEFQKNDILLSTKISKTKEKILLLNQELSSKNLEFNILIEKISASEICLKKLNENIVKLQEFYTIEKEKMARELEDKDVIMKQKSIFLDDLKNKIIKRREINRIKMDALEAKASKNKQLIDESLDKMENEVDAIEHLILEYKQKI